MDKQFYTVAELSEAIRISRQALQKRIKAGDIRALRAGNEYRIPADEFKKIITEGFVIRKGGRPRARIKKQGPND